MKCQNCGPYVGKLVHQLPGVVALAYDLRLSVIIPRFEDLKEKAKNKVASQFGTFSISSFSLQTLFRASKWLWKFKTRKTTKNSKLCYN